MLCPNWFLLSIRNQNMAVQKTHKILINVLYFKHNIYFSQIYALKQETYFVENIYSKDTHPLT